MSIAVADECPQCGEALRDKGWRARTVLEMQPVVVEPCGLPLAAQVLRAACRQAVQANAPAVLPKSLFGNQLIAEVLTSHYVHGEPMGRISERLGLGLGSLLEMAHRTGRLISWRGRRVERRIPSSYGASCG
ncbi:MAG: hypothetical protein WKF84_27610 [Pyrinomonadaceae bacterium]